MITRSDDISRGKSFSAFHTVSCEPEQSRVAFVKACVTDASGDGEANGSTACSEGCFE